MYLKVLVDMLSFLQTVFKLAHASNQTVHVSVVKQGRFEVQQIRT
jgi:hypothetical protein